MEESMDNPKNNPKLPTDSGEKAGPKVIQRWSAARKREIVLRLLRGESLDMISREIGIEPYRLERWRDKALAAMDAGLILQLSLLIDQEFGGLSLPVAGLGDGLMDPTPERPGENEVEAEASTQLEAGDEAADLGHAEGNECAGSSAPFWEASSTRIAARKASASIDRVMCRYQPCQRRTS